MSEIEPGDTVEWEVRALMTGTRKPRGEVLETNVEKFGHDDVIVVDSPTDPNDETYIRPDDVTRVI